MKCEICEREFKSVAASNIEHMKKMYDCKSVSHLSCFQSALDEGSIQKPAIRIESEGIVYYGRE